MKERIYLWDNLKVVLIMMVVMTHSVNPYQLEGYDWIQYLWIFIMTYTMPCFMMISGFWYKPRNSKYCLIHYLWPCLLFTFVNIFVGGVILGVFPKGNIPIKSGFAMWYIWALFVYGMITPWLLKTFSLTQLLALSIAVSFVCGFKFISNNWLDAQRIVHFYPFYVTGMWLRTKERTIYEASRTVRRNCLWVFLLCHVAYFLLCYRFPCFCYGTGFGGSHGLSLVGFAFKWTNFIMTLTMSICLMMVMPNKELGFSRYGSRTMNVYMLHMAIIFPLSWYYLRPVMDEWYGYLLYVVVVPSLCLILFSKRVDDVMKIILSLPNKLLYR